MDATRIVAVRHGETAWNLDTRIQGQLDIGLNDTGRWQARRVGEVLALESVAAVYSSDLMRAWHTAEEIACRARVSAVVDRGLRERHCGMLEGKTFREIEQAWPEHAQNWRKRILDWQPPEGGESLLQLRERVQETVARLASRHAGELVVMVAHGSVLNTLYRVATGQPDNVPRTWHSRNGAINRLLWTPEGMSLVGWADTLHLEGGTREQLSA